MFERFTGESRQVVVLAQEAARDLGHGHIGTEHLLLALLTQDTRARTALTGLGMTIEGARAAVLEAVPRGAAPPGGHIPFTPRAKTVLELSLREALNRGDEFIGPEHLLLGVVREGGGIAAQVLTREGRTLDQVRTAVTALAGPGGAGAKPSRPGARTPAAEQVLALAENLAAGAPVGSHHLLEALAAVDAGMGGRALAALGVTGDALTAQFDALDPLQTADATPEQAAAATMSLTADAGTVTLTCTDAQLVGTVRGLVEKAGGPLTGEGVLAGQFIALHAVLTATAGAIAAVLDPESSPSGEPGQRTGLLERLRRRRRSG